MVERWIWTKKGPLAFLTTWVSANWNFMKNEASDNMGGHGAKNFWGGFGCVSMREELTSG